MSISADGSVKMWKSFDFEEDYFESIEQCTNHCLMGSFLYRKDSSGAGKDMNLEIPTSASWLPSHPNMLVISYRSPLLGLFDRITV